MEIQDVYEIEKRLFTRNTRKYLIRIETATTYETRATIAYDLFNYLYDNINFVTESPRLCEAIIERIVTIKGDIETGDLNITAKTCNQLNAALSRIKDAIEDARCQ